MKPWRRYLLPPVLIVSLGVVLNYGYVAAHVNYLLRPDVIASPRATGIFLPGEHAEPLGEPNLLRVDRLGIRAPIRYVDTASEPAFQEALRTGVVHYPGTAAPGAFGNAYIFGHSSDYVWSKGDYKTIFALLTNIKIGDTIVATDGEGHLFTYEVTRTSIVAPNDLSVLDQHGNTKKLLTLQTSYPVGTALKRFIVVAEMAEAQPSPVR